MFQEVGVGVDMIRGLNSCPAPPCARSPLLQKTVPKQAFAKPFNQAALHNARLTLPGYFDTDSL